MVLYILGRQPHIGLAELESLYEAKDIRPIGGYGALVDTEKEIAFSRIGGALKVCKLLNILDTTDWRDIQDYLEKNIPSHLASLPEGKLHLGLSTYGLSISPQKITATGLNLKKVIRSSGRSVRLVPNQEASLNSAQVLHNKLTQELGWELVIIKDNNKTILAQTTNVQNIEAYTFRDRSRPKRDARVGMLPPKLAQTMINLSGAKTEGILLDPFCGTGVVLQEAALMGFGAYGSDLDERMVSYTKDNLEWLSKTHKLEVKSRVEQGDACDARWQSPIDTVVSETYLGRPFTTEPQSTILQQTIHDCDLIIKKFLKNIAPQLKPSTKLCLAVPVWFVHGRSHHLTTLDSLAGIGYNRIDFVHASREDLVYHREDQIVGRELLVLTRK